MNSRKFAAACVGAALSLAVAPFGASPADYTQMNPLQPPPAPPPPLDIHGFFDVTFGNDWITRRGLVVTNSGLTTQIVNGLTFGLYKDPNTWINSFSITAGTFNDMWSQQNNVTVGSWNEFDWWVSADWTIAKYWKIGVTYITFLSPPGNFRQERNVGPYIRFDERALTPSAAPPTPPPHLFYPPPAPPPPTARRTARCGSCLRAWASRSELSRWSRMSRVSDRPEPPRFRERDVRLLPCSPAGARTRAERFESL